MIRTKMSHKESKKDTGQSVKNKLNKYQLFNYRLFTCIKKHVFSKVIDVDVVDYFPTMNDGGWYVVNVNWMSVVFAVNFYSNSYYGVSIDVNGVLISKYILKYA